MQWPMHELSPLTGGQITHFINYWFPQLADKGLISNDEAHQYSMQLLQALHDPKRHKLRTMAENPLLLSMMIFVLADNGALPRDRHSLYEQILTQLLGQWDAKRDGLNLGEAIGDVRITSQELRNRVLDRVCYDAHLQSISADSRGRIQADILKKELMEYFARAQVADPYRTAERCLDYIDQRSGLLQPDDDGKVYAFAHLTLQEHAAGCHLISCESIQQILALRHDDRWREPIFLGVGCLTSEKMGPSKIGELLTALVDSYEYQGAPKSPSIWYRDLVLAAELGVDRDWGLLSGTGINVSRIKRILREGLATLLNDREHGQLALQSYYGKLIDPVPLLIKDRQHAAELLSTLDDPRYPVSLDQWQKETSQLSQHFSREGIHYWRYIPTGQYQVSGWNEQETAKTVNLLGYWIGRFMITIEQYQVFIDANGYQNDTWWENGSEWKNEHQRIAPLQWDQQVQQQYHNQPVSGVNWYEAVAYCNWLNQQLRNLLPEGYRIYLPSEAEWEVATAYNNRGQRYPYPWGKRHPIPEYAVYDWNKERRPLSVGLGIMGQASSGIIDAVGNLWEWTATPLYGSADSTMKVLNGIAHDDWIMLRGGGYDEGNPSISCKTFKWPQAYSDLNLRGFRCVLAPC